MNWVKSLYLPIIHFRAGNLANQKGEFVKSPEVRFAGLWTLGKDWNQGLEATSGLSPHPFISV